MATRESADGQVQLPRMGGLNERPAPNALESPNFDICQGLYPARDGLLQRLECRQLLAQGRGLVRQIAQLDDGTGQIVVQDSNGTETLYSLDELFGRPDPEVDLTLVPITEEDSMSMALIVHTETATTNGGSLNSGAGSEALDTFYTQKLTAVSVNEDTIVSDFVADGGGAGENTFKLAAGDYRVGGFLTFCAVYRNVRFSATITIASPGVVTTSIAHGFVGGESIQFSTSGALPTGLTAGTRYYVLAAGITSTTFRVSATSGGSAINTSGTQSGDHLVLTYANSNGATAVAAIYDETNSIRLSDSTPAKTNDTIIGTTPTSVTFERQIVVGFCGWFTLAGLTQLSIKAAVASGETVNWADDTTCRGKAHNITTVIGGSALSNVYTQIKILKEA